MCIKKTIYKLGVKYRNPSLVPQLNELLKSDFYELTKLQEIQTIRLRSLCERAYNYSPYYKNIMDSLGIIPSEIELKDLPKFPVITKRELIDNVSKIQSKEGFKKLRLSETSGTTGEPLKIYRNEEWDSATRAAMFRGYSWHGVKPYDKNAYFWGYNIDPKEKSKIKFLDDLQNRFRLFSYKEADIIDFCKKLDKCVYISGYSSMIYEVAKRINDLGLSGKFPKLKMVKGTSEKIFDSYQEEVIKAFGKKMIGEYGAMETGIISYECPEGNMHIAEENVIVEEENGEIIVTNLHSMSFPIIRYKLGDKVILAPDDFKCKCGRKHRVIHDVVGRIGKNIYGKENKYPSLTFYYVFKNIALKDELVANYQAVQNIKGEVLLKIEQQFSEKLDRSIKRECDKYFGNDVLFKIEYGQVLHKMDGKLKDFITTIE